MSNIFDWRPTSLDSIYRVFSTILISRRSERVVSLKLLEAVKSNDYQAVHKALIEGEVDVNAVDKNDPLLETALIIAAKNNNRTIMSTLLQIDGIDINKPNRNGSTALCFAVMNNNASIVTTLLDWGANQNICETIGRTPLVIAIENNSSFIVKLLLSRRGLDLETIDAEGNTPLIIAVKKGNVYIVSMLMKKGSDPFATNFAGETPRSCAELQPNAEELISALEWDYDHF